MASFFGTSNFQDGLLNMRRWLRQASSAMGGALQGSACDHQACGNNNHVDHLHEHEDTFAFERSRARMRWHRTLKS